MIDLKLLGQRLGRPLYTLIALTEQNDPFYAAGLDYRRKGAEWFAQLWNDLNLPTGVHVRRIHYRLTALDITMPNGERYENTQNCSKSLGNAVRDAIYLDLLPGATIVDNKNPEPKKFLAEAGESPRLLVYGGEDDDEDEPIFSYADAVPELTLPELPDLPSLPGAWLQPRPQPALRYHLEVWIEKSTMDDILEPVGRREGVNIITGGGELSATACRDCIDRIVASGRPAARILYISDFDPKGIDMPVSVARKLEYEKHKRGLDLDLQVRPIALTHAQCVELSLPRTPTKDTDPTTAGFEKRFGEGQTELDALEALHPGRLAQIVTAEIRRYRDPTLASRTADAARRFESQVQQVVAENNEAFEAEHAKLEEQLAPIRQELQELNEAFEHEIELLAAAFDERAGSLVNRCTLIFNATKRACHAARISLDEKLPDINAVEWPVAQVGDEDADPLYDSTRDYVVQMDRYKAHQEKPIARRPRKPSRLKPIDKSKLTPKQAQYRAWYEKNRDRILAKKKLKDD